MPVTPRSFEAPSQTARSTSLARIRASLCDSRRGRAEPRFPGTASPAWYRIAAGHHGNHPGGSFRVRLTNLALFFRLCLAAGERLLLEGQRFGSPLPKPHYVPKRALFGLHRGRLRQTGAAEEREGDAIAVISEARSGKCLPSAGRRAAAQRGHFLPSFCPKDPGLRGYSGFSLLGECSID